MLDLIIEQDAVNSIFGFSGFVAGLALLIVVFTITDIRYHFRIAIVPFNLRLVTFLSIIAIGIITLITDVGFAEHYPSWLKKQDIWQGIMGMLAALTNLFLCLHNLLIIADI